MTRIPFSWEWFPIKASLRRSSYHRCVVASHGSGDQSIPWVGVAPGHKPVRMQEDFAPFVGGYLYGHVYG